MPNYSSGAMRLGAVYLPSRGDMNNFLAMMEELSRRVYRTGLNKSTAGGNFRLPIRGLAIDPAASLVYTKIDTDFPTDSHGRYIKFMKSSLPPSGQIRLRCEIDEEIQLDRIVLGIVDNLADIDLKAFEKTFRISKSVSLQLVKWLSGRRDEMATGTSRYFTLITAIMSRLLGLRIRLREEAHVINEALYAEASGAVKKDTKKSRNPSLKVAKQE